MVKHTEGRSQQGWPKVATEWLGFQVDPDSEVAVVWFVGHQKYSGGRVSAGSGRGHVAFSTSLGPFLPGRLVILWQG